MPKMREPIDVIDRADAKADLEERLRKGEITIGEAIREIRVTWLALQQKHLARMVGISKNTLGAIERGEGTERIATLEKILKPLGYRITMIPDLPPESEPER